MMEMPDRLGRVLVSDRGRLPESSPVAEALLALVAQHGATSLVLREKDLSDERLLEIARDLVSRASVPVVVAHRPDVARDSGAAGVHLGWNSPSVSEARAMVGPSCVVGASVHDVGEGEERARDGADYLFLGPIRTSPKQGRDQPPLGFLPLREMAGRVDIPVVGIGGLTLEDEPAVLAAGAAGWAAIRAFL